MGHDSPNATLTNADGWNAFRTGNYHLGFAAVGLVLVGTALVLGLVSGNWLVVAGLMVAILGAAVLVDTWAHGWFH